MAKFDQYMGTLSGFPGYEGNPPSTEEEYNTLFSEWQAKPSWAEVQSGISSYVDPTQSGYQKLLDLGLTQAEATALTGYKPE